MATSRTEDRGRRSAGIRSYGYAWVRSRPPAITLLLGCVAIIGLLTLASILSKQFGDPRLRLEIDEEGSVGAWFSCVQFFAGAVGCGLVALLHQRLRRRWGLLALILLGFSLLDVTQLHHPVENAADVEVAVFGWQLLALAIVVLVLARAALPAAPGARPFLVACAACLVIAHACSIGYNALDPPVWAVTGLGVFEETFEMSAGALVLAAAVQQLAPKAAWPRAEAPAFR